MSNYLNDFDLIDQFELLGIEENKSKQQKPKDTYCSKLSVPERANKYEQFLEFKNPDLLEEALTHRCFYTEKQQDARYLLYNNNKKHIQFNERLEFLGDSVIGFFLSDYLFNKYPQYQENQLSLLKDQLCNQKSLAKVALIFQMDQKMHIGKGSRAQKVHLQEKPLCDTFEAYIGAVCKDRGFEFSKKYLQSIIEKYFDLDNLQSHKEKKKFDPKGEFQKLIQKKFKNQFKITYKENGKLNITKTNYHKFIMGLYMNDQYCQVFGEGPNKKVAEFQCAERAIKLLEQNKLLLPQN